MYRIAHISDLHFAPLIKPSVTELLSKRLIGYINWQRNRRFSMNREICGELMQSIQSQKIDHLVVTGDLVNLATQQEFIQTSNWLIREGKPQNISIVPGNHDLYVPGALPQFINYFSKWINSDYLIENLPTLNKSSHFPFPYIRVRNNIALIGLCSAIPQPPFISAGYLNQKQLEDLSTILDYAKNKNYFRIIIMHHPPSEGYNFWYKSLWNSKKFMSVVNNNGAELIVHGHTHRATFNPSLFQRTPVVGVTPACQTSYDHHSVSGYNLFSIKQVVGGFFCVVERFQRTEHNGFKRSFQQKWTVTNHS